MSVRSALSASQSQRSQNALYPCFVCLRHCSRWTESNEDETRWQFRVRMEDLLDRFPLRVPGGSVLEQWTGEHICLRGDLGRRIDVLGLSFLICKTKGTLTFSDPLEVLGGGSKLVFGKACVTLRAKTSSKYKVNYRDCLPFH